MSGTTPRPDDDVPKSEHDKEFTKLDPETRDWSLLGVSKGDYVKIVAGIIFGLVPGILIALFGFWLNSKTPHLKVRVPDTIVYKGEKSKLGIVNVNVTNDGSQQAEDIECMLSLPETKIQEVKVAPEILHPTIESSNDKITVRVKSLNPGEDFLISALANNPDKLPAETKVEVRGKGVVGEREATITGTPNWLLFVLVLLVSFETPALIALISGAYVNKRIVAMESQGRQQRYERLKGIMLRRTELLLLRSKSSEETGKETASEIKRLFDDFKPLVT